MSRHHLITAVTALLLASVPAFAKMVTKLDLRGMRNFSDAPEIEVLSLGGKRWDRVNETRLSNITLSNRTKCRLGGTKDRVYQRVSAAYFSTVGESSLPADKLGKRNVFSARVQWVGSCEHTIRPAEISNDELKARLTLQPGKSKRMLLSKGFVVDQLKVGLAISESTCIPAGVGFTDFKKREARFDAHISCEDSPIVATKIPKPKLKPKKMRLTPALNAVNLKVMPTLYEGKCPTTIKMGGTLDFNFPAEIKYQYLGDRGHKSPVFTFTKKSKGGKWNLAPWSRKISAPAPSKRLTTSKGKRGPDYEGWMKVKVISPSPMTTKPVKFSVNCHGTPKQGSTRMQIFMPDSKPERPKASPKKPRGKRKPREIVVVGSKAKAESQKKSSENGGKR